MNDRGQRLLEFAERQKLVVENTLHPHKNSRTTTWHSPNSLIHNQVDCIITPQRFKSSIIRSATITYPGADINSDHDLVMCNLHLKLRSNKRHRSTRIRCNIDRLKDSHISHLYANKLSEKLENIDTRNSDLTAMYTQFEDVNISTATEILGKYRKKKQPWITDDILDLCDERRSLKSKKKQKPELDSMYRKINMTIRKAMQDAKDNWIQIQCNPIDDDMRYGRYNKRAYNTLKILTKSSRITTFIIEDSNRKPISEESSILNRWTEYCHNLYNYPIQPDVNILNNTESLSKESYPDLTILKSEVSALLYKR